MGLLHLLIAALAVGSALAADPCKCVNVEQTINAISNPMIFFQNPTSTGNMNDKACSSPCTFIAHAANEAEDGLSIQILTNNLGTGKLTITDGLLTHVIVSSTVQSDMNWNSTVGSLTIDLTEAADNVGTFMLVIQKATRAPAPSVIPTTVLPPTPAYTGGLIRNPFLVADDIMIGIDLSSDRLEDLKAFAIDIVNNLTVTDSKDCGVGSRLALHGLSSYTSFSPQYFPDWEYTTENALGNIVAMTQIGKGPFYISDVDKFVKAGFPYVPTKPEDNCPNRGRIYILLATDMPEEYDNMIEANNEQIDFIGQGVHPILVSPLKDKNRNYYDYYAKADKFNKWSYYDLDKGTTDFFNNYLVVSSDDLTCQPTADQNNVTLTSDNVSTPKVVAIPPYYNAKKQLADDETKWNTIKHYCNFQSTTVTISQTNVPASLTVKDDVCLTVYYDLETDKDFVTIYSGDYAKGDQKEVVKLTGRDVSGTTFHLRSTYGSIVFTSDEKNVYDGFYAEITACGIAPTDPPKKA